MSPISLHHPTASDVTTLQHLNDEIMIDNHEYDPDLKMDWAQSEAGGKKYFSELVTNLNAICLIAKNGDQPIGYIAAAPKEIDYRNSKYLEIENMGVTPEYRSQGVGKMLMDECLRIAKERGFQKAYVNSYFQNSKAVNFYKNHGFSEIDISLEKQL